MNHPSIIKKLEKIMDFFLDTIKYISFIFIFIILILKIVDYN